MMNYTNLIDKVNIPELVKALRHCISDPYGFVECNGCPIFCKGIDCQNDLHNDAAAVIEALQAEVERLKDSNEELREKQTYIDHYGTEWFTSAKDVPNYAYEHGYADGRNEAEAQLPKRGKWRLVTPDSYIFNGYRCSLCNELVYGMTNYCPNCGAKMEVQDDKI